MYVIKTNAGNIYPVEKCVYRIGAATSGGYKLTHLDLVNVSGTPAPALQASLTAATAGDLLGLIAKTGRFVAITEPAT
tara:strand:+ start:22116 stop:22349 length:234 start_codon:yes stop_codon:yes gene_type:complete